MALKIGDRVRENTNSAGVGGLSLTGAPAGFQRFSAILSSGDTTYYALEENDKFEVGIGTYGSNNLERTTILSSSNSGNKISLGGSGVVFITYPAAKAFFASPGDEFTVPASGLVFSNGTVIKDAKLVELSDVNLSGTPVQGSVFDLNITNKSLSIGDLTGPTNSNNILIGYGAGSGITTGSDSVIIGAESSTINKTGQHNVHIGAKAGPVVSDASNAVYNSVAVGYSAGNKMRHESVAIGYEAALHAYEIGFVGIGYQVGSGIGSYATAIGYQAGRTLGEDYAVAIGYQAGYNGAGESAVWIGQGAGTSSTGSTRSIGIGKNAGKSSSGTECIYLGEGAGTSNSSNNLVFIGNSTPATNGTLIKGDMDSKRVAIGAADVTLDDTLFVGVNAANDEGIVVKAAASQVSNLTSWKNSSDSVLASVDKDGIISGHGIHATGNGIQITSATPASTSNKVYADGTDLYWNGSKVAVGTTPTFTNINVGQYIYHDGDSNTFIRLRADQIDFNAGGLNFLSLDEGSNDKVIINTGGNDIDFQVEGQNDLNLIRTDAANDLVGIGTSTPDYKLDIVGHGAIMQSSGVIVGNSGIVLANNVPSVTTNTLYNEGGTLKFSGSTIGGVDAYTSGVATYASGQAISNQGNITALLSASGTATSLIASSGIASYASGQAISNQSNIATNTSNISTNTARVSYASGQAISNQSNITALLSASGTATSLISSSGIATYASGQAVSNQSSIATNTSNISTNTGNINTNTARVNYASGQAIANESDIAALLTASGTATSLIASSGIATYASGQAIANESDIVAVSGIAAYASGVGGGGGDVTTAQLNYVSGIAVYSSGLAITNEAEVTYASGLAITNEARVNYASGQAISNQSNITALNTASGIATSLLAVSGTATSLVATSGIATYASGQAISNQGNITALLSASGTATSLIASSGIASYASGQAVENESDIVAVSGIAAFSSGVVTDVDVIIGQVSTTAGTGIAIGYGAGLDSSIDTTNSINGYKASDVLIGHFAGSGYIHHAPTSIAKLSSEQQNVMIGFKAGANSLNYRGGSTALGDNVYIGVEAGHTASGYHRVCIGDEAGHFSSGNRVVAIGANCFENSEGDDNTAVGYRSGGYSTGDHNLYLGHLAGFGVIGANNIELLTEGPNPSLIGSNSNKVHIENTIIGDTSAKKIAIGNIAAGDLTPDATLEVKPKVASDIGVIVQGVVSHSANLQEWQNSSEEVLARVEPNGVIFSSGVTASGLLLPNHVPADTTNTLYNEGGTLKFNGSAVGGGSGGTSAEATYASGQAISNQGNITALLTASGTATSLIASSGIATYASGQAIANEGDLVAVSGIAAYASGVSLTVKEADNNPSVANVRTIVVSNGTLTDNGGGQVTLTTGGGGGGGDVTTTQLNYVSGIAVYASGQSQSLNTVSGVATSLLAVSGTATSLISTSGIAAYASGQAIANESDIVAVSGIGAYASGQAIANESDIVAVSGIAAFSSGVVTGEDVTIGQHVVEGSYVEFNGTGIAIGYAAGAHASIDTQATINTTTANDVIIGPFAGSGYIHRAPTSVLFNSDRQNTMIGYLAGSQFHDYLSSTSSLGFNLLAGVGAGQQGSGYQNTYLGYVAGQEGSGNTNLSAGVLSRENSSGNNNNCFGYRAGGYHTGGYSLYLGHLAGFATQGSNNIELITQGPNPSIIGSNSDKLHIENTIIGDTSAKKLAIGNVTSSDLTPDATVEVKPKIASDIGVIVQGVASHSANLQEWQNSSEEVLARVEANGVIFSSGVTASGLLLPNHVPVSTTNTLYNEGGTLKFNGSAVGGGGGDVSTAQLNYVSGIAVYGSGQSTSLNTASGIVTALINSSGVATYASGQSTSLNTASGVAVYASGQVNVSVAGTATASKALVLDSAKSFTGAKHGVFNQFDSRLTASGITIGASGVTLTGGAYVQEAVPANDTPTAEDATVTLDLSTGNFHNISLGQNVTKFEFTNAKRGQRFILRITQNGSSAKTVAWTNVDYTTGGAAATVRWAGNVVPTMSTSTSHTDVYGFLCTNNAGSAFDGFIIGQDLPD